MREPSAGTEASITRRRVQELADVVAKFAEETETERTLPRALVDQLRDAGCFRMLTPRSHGGDELDFPETTRILEDLARVDGSTAWAVMVASEAPYLAARLARDVFDEVLLDGADVEAAGVFAPKGTATAVEGGYLVSGRWPFASGCRHARWIGGNCVVVDATGAPLGMRLAMLPAEQWEIVDTWHTLGLRGTGSCDVTLCDAFVPARLTLDLFGRDICVDSPCFRMDLFSFFSLHVAAVAVGIAQGAIDDIVEVAATKQSSLTFDLLADNAIFHLRLGEAETMLRAARAVVEAEAARAWARALRRETPDEGVVAATRASAVWVTDTAMAVAEAAFQAGGGSAIYQDGTLQRRFRDLRSLRQHGVLAPSTTQAHGRSLLAASAPKSQ